MIIIFREEKNRDGTKRLLITHKSIKAIDPYDKKKKDMCTIFYGLGCEEHEKIMNELGGKVSVKTVPANFLLNPDLSIINELKPEENQGGGGSFMMDSGQGSALKEADIKNAILQAQGGLGLGLVGADWVKAKKHQKEADDSFEKESYKKALTELNSIKALGRKLPDTYSQFIDGKFSEINSKGEELLDKALGNENLNAKEAGIRDVMDKFKGLDVEKRAKEELDKLKENK